MTSSELDWEEGMRRVRLFLSMRMVHWSRPACLNPTARQWSAGTRNADFPAYRVKDELVPFTPMAQFAPLGYRGDFFVDHFTDAAIKARWAEAKTDPTTRERIIARVMDLQIPHQFRGTGCIDPRGLIDPHAENVDLRVIRRPGFFAAAPWNEPIATIDSRTSIVEVTVPREPHEIIHMGLRDPIRLRGWHIAGDGLPDGKGGKVKALAILDSGRNIETTAIHHPNDDACYWMGGSKPGCRKAIPTKIGAAKVAASARGAAISWRSSRPVSMC